MVVPERARKVAIVGASAVGKSTVTVQFTEKRFVDAYYPTIENQFSHKITYNGVEYTTEIIDTAGQDEFSIMSQKVLIGIHGYMLVYSIGSRVSFDLIPIIRDKILNATGTDAMPMILVGNKSDLTDSQQSQRQVSFEEGEKLAKSLKMPFIETSAKTNVNVEKAFQLLVSEMDHTTPSQEAPGKCVVS